jgi:hypothetical protein
MGTDGQVDALCTPTAFSTGGAAASRMEVTELSALTRSYRPAGGTGPGP